MRAAARWARRLLGCWATGWLLFVSPVSAQQRTLKGRVLAGSQPVAGQAVTLHRVTDGGGETLATDTTDAQGGFSFEYAPAGEAIHFGATRYQNQLYIGETFREAPVQPDYTISVGPGATPINLGPVRPEAAAQPPPADNSARKAGIMIVVTVALLGVSIFAFAMSRRTDPRRRLLIEVADLDNRHADAPLDNYEAQRAELLRRLRETA